MTDQEIDKWVEYHLDGIDKDPILNDLYIKVGQEIAHKFYELGKEEGKKVVDYTAAFELEDRIRYEEQ